MLRFDCMMGTPDLFLFYGVEFVIDGNDSIAHEPLVLVGMRCPLVLETDEFTSCPLGTPEH